MQRRPVPGDPRDGRRRPGRRRRRRGGGDDDQHVAQRRAGVRVRRGGRDGARLAPLRRERRGLQRDGQLRLRRLRRERRDREPRRRPAARGRRHLRQPPDQRLQPRRDVRARVAVVHEPAERVPRAAARLGAVHPLAGPEGRGRPLPPPHGRLAGHQQDPVAAVDGLSAVDRRPRPRRPQRGHRDPQRGEGRAVRDAGLRVHGARHGRRSARRHKGFRRLPLTRRPGGRRRVPADRDPGAHDRQPARRPPPGDRRLDARRRRARRLADRPQAVAVRLRPRPRRRRSPARSRPPIWTATGAPSWCSARTGRRRARAASSCSAPRGRRLYDIRLRGQGSDGNGIGIPAAPSIADIDRDGRLEIVVSTFDHGIDVYRVPRSSPGRLPWPTGRGGLLRAGT